MRALLCVLLISTFSGCDEQQDQPLLTKECSLTVFLRDDRQFEALTVVSAHTESDPTAHPMKPVDGGYSARITLPPKRVIYWIEADGDPLPDPGNPVTVLLDDKVVSQADFRGCDQPDLRFVEQTGAPDSPEFTLVMARSHPKSGLDARSVTAHVGQDAVPVRVEGDHIYVHIKERPAGKYWLGIQAKDVSGRPMSFGAPFWIESTVFRWSRATLYHLLVDRFAASEDLGPRQRARPPGVRIGGNLPGVIRKIESGYFDNLGIDALWLSPLYMNAAGTWTGVEGGPARYEAYHGYWPVRARAIEPNLGTEEDLHALVQAAHARGIRVILDVVPNHVHRDHEYRRTHPEWFQDTGCVCGSAACPWWRDIQTCWFTDYLPDVQWSAPGALDQFVDDMVWWLETFDLDGLRIDAVPMMPRLVTRHLVKAVRDRFEGLGTQYYLLGETFTGPDGYDWIRYPLGAHGLDGQFDFPLMWALRAALAWDTMSMDELFDAWYESQAQWKGAGAAMANIIGNHDVTRFGSEAQGLLVTNDPWQFPAPMVETTNAHRRVRLALGFLLTMPGTPVIFYGDEFGQAGGRDPDNRRPMRFGAELTADERETLQITRVLGRLRRCHPALRQGDLEILARDTEQVVLRRSTHPGDQVLIRLSRDAHSMSREALSIPVNVGMLDVVSNRRWTPSADASFPPKANAFNLEVWIPEAHPCAQ